MYDQLDPSLNFFYQREKQLDSIFSPKSIAVIGATENPGSVGRTVMNNLLTAGFKGKLYPVNPKRPSVLGVKAFPSIASIGEPVDLAVIVTPAKVVPGLIAECAAAKVPTAVIISAGFKEMGEPGIKLEQEILVHARKGKMRIIGPNCLGVMRPSSHLNATFAADLALEGSIAFISQSGALCTAVLDWSLSEKVGFSAFVSIGSMVDVDWGDLIDYFGSDPKTKSILIYMESIGNPRSFLSAAREVSLSKPIILIKAGRSLESAQAAASHTGALAGSDQAFSAALRRVGVLRVNSIADLFGMADLIGKQPRPKGPHLTIVTNAGGPGVIATDALIESGGKLAELSPVSMEAYNQLLPPHWSRNNPVDILGDASADTYAKVVDIALKDPHTDGLLVILTPQDMTDPTATANKLAHYAHQKEKPILASWMGRGRVEEGEKILSAAGIPTFEFPDLACKAFASMWRSAYNLAAIYEVPTYTTTEEACSLRIHRVEKILNEASPREILDEVESKKVLEAYGLPVVPTEVAKDAAEAAVLADKMGYPVVLKIYSRTITHKTDVGGVKLNLNNKHAVMTAFDEIYASVKKLKGIEHFQGVTVQPMIRQLEGYELILGSSIDREFGPVLLFGFGGQLVEVFEDRSLALPPLTSTLARRMMEQTKIYQALKGVRGRKPVDLKKLEEILVQFSYLVLEHPRIKECDINPLLASPERLIALDARIILHPPGTDLPRPAIRPYPMHYEEEWKLKSGAILLLRPIRPDDEPLIAKFHQELSQETVRQRWLKDLRMEERVSHERLSKICFIDYDREIVLVAETAPSGKGAEIVGVGRVSKIPGTPNATFGLVIKDQWQNQGIGHKLMQKLIQAAKDEKIQEIAAPMLKENTQMQAMCKRLGFSVEPKGNLMIATLRLHG
jgi:acetyltransferase